MIRSIVTTEREELHLHFVSLSLFITELPQTAKLQAVDCCDVLLSLQSTGFI